MDDVVKFNGEKQRNVGEWVNIIWSEEKQR